MVNKASNTGPNVRVLYIWTEATWLPSFIHDQPLLLLFLGNSYRQCNFLFPYLIFVAFQVLTLVLNPDGYSTLHYSDGHSVGILAVSWIAVCVFLLPSLPSYGLVCCFHVPFTTIPFSPFFLKTQSPRLGTRAVLVGTDPDTFSYLSNMFLFGSFVLWGFTDPAGTARPGIANSQRL